MSESENKEERIVDAEEEEMEEAPVEEAAKPQDEKKTTAESAPAAEEEEAEGQEEIEVVEEKIYTISLRHAWVVTPRGKRAPRAVRDVRDFVSRHMKAEEVSMSNEVNNALWARGINKPPRKITVRAVKDKEGKVIVYPAKAA
jgi:large subunit ribosomal protein L31e